MDTAPPSRGARSKTGCLTCRNRKVRCDEQRPRCAHCERLNLECRWRPAHANGARWRIFVGPSPGTSAASSGQRHSVEAANPQTNGSSPSVAAEPVEAAAVLQGDGTRPSDSTAWAQSPAVIDELFDYASFMWNANRGWGYLSPDAGAQANDMSSTSDLMDPWACVSNPVVNPKLTPNSTVNLNGRSDVTARDILPMGQTNALQIPEDSNLIDYFIRTVVPPILAEVESQKRWASMRQVIISMSNASSMVRYAILAFTNLLYCREVSWYTSPNPYYEDALKELMALEEVCSPSGRDFRQEHLATIFFLCYVDILDDRMESAHLHLQRAFDIFQRGRQYGFRAVEIRLLSWIRLLDARAVSAGGEGLFLSDNSESLIVQPSPGRTSETEPSEAGRDEVQEWDTEDILFQVLYHPGINFFQKVQSFMGRISKIDPWHRSRGTVEDEIEVMQIASRILQDLRDLYDDRPVLMDHAVEGKLTQNHVSASLAIAITRAFRTYLSNYHASKIHLHRVAYKHLPLSRESTGALTQIRRLTKLLVEDLEPDAVLPVSQLWPLLMLGSEEKDHSERNWINEQILRMQKVATNASITAHVLREVQARQDAGKERVDIRAVMHDVFDTCFAIM
ncbi:hypothetical protein ACJ41O_009308 [Fusarium nematophilum]